MGVDARMFVKLATPVDDAALIDAAYRLAEACGDERTFWLSRDEDLARGEVRRALNRVTDACGGYRPVEADGTWLEVSLWGRYYGPGYERGDLWDYIAAAEWCERNFAGCTVFYGGDCGEGVELFDRADRETFIAHWAEHGGRPYYARDGKPWRETHAQQPTCPLCQHPATQYGSGGQFASWTCDACGRHWVWVGADVRAYPAGRDFDSFAAAKAQRDELTAKA